MISTEQDFHTVEGEGENSYTKNSRCQEIIFRGSIPMLENGIRKVFETLGVKTMTIVDLGCSSGPNTLLFVSKLIDITTEQCNKAVECDPMELLIFLNDLPGNDFNQVFRSLENLEKGTSDQKGNTPLFYHISGLPKSYYNRLLPKESVHLFHSSSSLHWRSQVPEVLEASRDALLNKDNIYISETSTSFVVKCFREQFNKDFSTFLKLRHEELVYGGNMVLTFCGRKDENVYNGDLNKLFGLLAMSLQSLVTKGLVESEKLDSFNLPFYGPSISEVKYIVMQSHMFELDHIKLFEINWDPYDTEGDDVHDSVCSGINVSKFIRAALEPMIARHFGETILDTLFTEYAFFVSKHLQKEKTKFAIITMSLTKV